MHLVFPTLLPANLCIFHSPLCRLAYKQHETRVCRAIAAGKNKKKQENDAQPEKKMEKSFLPNSETPQKILCRRLARSKIIGHSDKTTDTRAATTAKLSVVCPKTLSKVHAVGARDLCAPQHLEEKQTTRQHGVDATRKRRPPTHKYVARYATLPNVEREPGRATHVEKNTTTTAPSEPRVHAHRRPQVPGRYRTRTPWDNKGV